MSDDRIPVFAVIMAAYDSAITLPRAIESVLAQTFQSFTLVIVDDGSTDDTRCIAQRYASGDSRVHVVSQDNAGTGAARNAGVAASESHYVCFLDADDAMLPEYLSAQSDFMKERAEYAVVSCLAYESRDGVRGPIWRAQVAEQVPTEHVLADLLEGNPIFVSSVVERSAFDVVGGFVPGRYAEDYDLWVRLLAAGYRQITNPVPLVEYSVGAGKSDRRDAEFDSMADTLEAVADGMLDDRPEEANALIRAGAVLRARAVRWRLEQRARGGDTRALHGIGIGERSAYRSTLMFVLAMVLGRIAPNLYLTWIGRSRRDAVRS